MTAEQARTAAHQILAESRFHQPGVPRPLRHVLADIGRIVEAPLRWLDDAMNAIGGVFPGGITGAWVAFALLFLALAFWAGTRHSAHALQAAGAGRVAAGGPDAATLEALAARAEAAGSFTDAVRLRFRAGLLRLAARAVIPSAQTTPNAQIARVLDDETFDALARDFDEITYGGRSADAADASEARAGWPRVLDRRARR